MIRDRPGPRLRTISYIKLAIGWAGGYEGPSPGMRRDTAGAHTTDFWAALHTIWKGGSAPLSKDSGAPF